MAEVQMSNMFLSPLLGCSAVEVLIGTPWKEERSSIEGAKLKDVSSIAKLGRPFHYLTGSVVCTLEVCSAQILQQ